MELGIEPDDGKHAQVYVYDQEEEEQGLLEVQVF